MAEVGWEVCSAQARGVAFATLWLWGCQQPEPCVLKAFESYRCYIQTSVASRKAEMVIARDENTGLSFLRCF